MSLLENKQLTDVDYWSQRPKVKVSPAVGRNSIQTILEAFIPRNPSGTIVEIGAFPGNKLAAFAQRLGYKPVAVDFVPEVHDLLPEFERLGIPGLRVFQEDFLKWNPDERFDVVFSYGFIEHFQDWEAVVRQQWALVKPQGWMVVEVPIFGPLQKLLRRLVFVPAKWQSAMQSHNQAAMSLRNLDGACRRLAGAQILFSSYLWQMHTWIRPGEPGVKSCAPAVLKVWRWLAKIPALFNWSCHLFSPNALVVVRKVSQATPD